MTAEEPLYRRDPKAHEEYLRQGNERQARHRMCADILLRDQAGRILLVDPTYKEEWDLPGGMAEENESPSDCVRREIREELGLDLVPGEFLCVEWVAPHGPWDDLLAFVFNGGTLVDDQIAQIRLTDGELARFEFLELTEAYGRLSERTRRRLKQAVAAQESGAALYVHDGRTWA